jgi:hypothetical protein
LGRVSDGYRPRFTVRPVGIGREKRGEEKGIGGVAGDGRTAENRAREGRQRVRKREKVVREERESGFPKWKPPISKNSIYSNILK